MIDRILTIIWHHTSQRTRQWWGWYWTPEEYR